MNNLRTLEQTEEDIYNTLPQNFSKFVKGMVMDGKVPNMRISKSVSGPRLERIESYVDTFKKLPVELGFEMLKQEASLGKIKTSDVDYIMTIVKLQESL